MATAAVLSLEIEENFTTGESAIALSHDEPQLTTLAIHLWQAGSCPGGEADEGWQDESDTVACHASCL